MANPDPAAPNAKKADAFRLNTELSTSILDLTPEQYKSGIYTSILEYFEKRTDILRKQGDNLQETEIESQQRKGAIAEILKFTRKTNPALRPPPAQKRVT